MHACEYVRHVHAQAHGNEKGTYNPLELELQALWATLWVLGSKSGSSTRAVNTLTCWAISPARELIFILMEHTYQHTCLTTAPAIKAGLLPFQVTKPYSFFKGQLHTSCYGNNQPDSWICQMSKNTGAYQDIRLLLNELLPYLQSCPCPTVPWY